MDGQSLVSVVILNYNGKHLLKKCLDSVLSSKYSNFEVIFVDNASTDGSIDYVDAEFNGDSRLKIIQNSTNLGFAEGNNIGANQAMGEYVIFLNNDTKVDQYWLTELVKVFKSDSKIGACQSKLLLMEDSKRFDCAGGVVDYLGFPFGRGDFKEDRGQYDQIEEIFHGKGAALAIKHQVIEDVGLFDSGFIYYYEEVDLCWRIRLKGYKVVFAPKSIVYHLGGSSTARHPSSLKAFHATKNHLVMLMKNYDSKNVAKRLPIVVFLRLVESIFFFLNKRSNLALAKLYAFLWVLKHLRNIWYDRIVIQQYIRSVPDEHIIRYMRNPDLSRLRYHFRTLYY